MAVNQHLVILKRCYFNAIVDGRKTIEARLAKTRHAPFGQISVGDKLFLKISSGPVCATATVEKIQQFDNLSPAKIERLKNQYNNFILGADEYWESKRDSKYGVLVWLADIRRIKPVSINKRDWRAWVVLSEKADFGLLNCCDNAI